MNALKAVASTKWGRTHEDLRSLYIGLIRSVMEYGSAGWMLCLSPSNLSTLELEQNKAARLITGKKLQKAYFDGFVKSQNPQISTS